MGFDISFLLEDNLNGEVPLSFSEDRVIVDEALALQRLIILVMNGAKYPVEGEPGISLSDSLSGDTPNNTDIIKDLAQLAAQHAVDVINSENSELRDLVNDVKVRVNDLPAPDEAEIVFTLNTTRGQEISVRLPIKPEDL